MRVAFRDAINSFEAIGDEAFVEECRLKYLAFVDELAGIRNRVNAERQRQALLGEMQSIANQLSALKSRYKFIDLQLSREITIVSRRAS